MTYIVDNTCYKSTEDELKDYDHMLILGFDFKESVFMHAITHVADLRSKRPSYEDSDVSKLYQNYNIYIGDNVDYTDNTKCEGGPFLNVDDIDSYQYD